MINKCFFAMVAICMISQSGCARVAPKAVDAVKSVIVNSGDDIFKASTKVAKPVISNSTDDIAKIGVKVASTGMIKLKTALDLAFQSVLKVKKIIDQMPPHLRMKISSNIWDRYASNEQALENEVNNMDKNTNSEQACKQTRERIERITQESEAIARLLKNIG